MALFLGRFAIHRCTVRQCDHTALGRQPHELSVAQCVAAAPYFSKKLLDMAHFSSACCPVGLPGVFAGRAVVDGIGLLSSAFC
mmetsp:Transcript_172332/g.419062  ORF Transcript_172332/g.419062 Transcript_172332/m.419062 type:complete len:83 (+) Transcript_172332:588-836(+)